MSLFGRNIIDRIKHSISRRITLPVPPYHSPAYWEKVYSRLDENDVFEWGDIDFKKQLKRFNFRINEASIIEIRKVYGDKIKVSDWNTDDETSGSGSGSGNALEVHNVEFQQALFEEEKKSSSSNNEHNDDYNNSSILVLGCGNSKLGEDVLHYFLDMHTSTDSSTTNSTTNSARIKEVQVPKIIQCDVSTHVVNSMTKRYHKYIDKNQMSILQDDATQFTLLHNESIDAVVDKGLVDALFCSDQGAMIQQVMSNVHRTLKVGKVFMFFSFSRPEYLLKHTCSNTHHTDVVEDIVDDSNRNKIINNKMKLQKDDNINWSRLDVWELDDIFIYRFVKAAAVDTLETPMSNLKHHKKLRQKEKRRRN